MVDKAKFPRDKICGDALSGKVAEVLRRTLPNVLDELDTGELFRDSWGVDFIAPNGESLKVPFKTDYNTEDRAPGFISKRTDFDTLLLQRALEGREIEFFEEVELRSYERIENGFLATDSNGKQYSASIVIAADGAYSHFGRTVGGIKAEGRDLCFGLRAYYDGVEGLDKDGFIELHFIKDVLPGYFWIFPLPNGAANVGIGMRADRMKDKGVNLKKTFERLINEHPVIGPRFKNATLQERVRLFDLPLGNKKRKLSGDSYMLIGDAAALIDPFTGEGIGNAMISGEYAASAAHHAIQEKNFSASFLRSYDRAVYERLGDELHLSTRMQQLVNYPWLFNFVVRKANRNQTLRETISCMFEDVDLRGRLKDPRFYAKILFQ